MPLTEPVPAVWAKLTLIVLSAPVVTVFPAVSCTVAVKARGLPEARSLTPPESAI